MPLLFIAYVALGLIQVAAWMEGLQLAFGWGSVAAVFTFVVLIALGSFGGIITSSFAFYGAWKGWHWNVLGAALLTFPFVVLNFAVAGVGTLVGWLTHIPSIRNESPRSTGPISTPAALEHDPKILARRGFASDLDQIFRKREVAWEVSAIGDRAWILKIMIPQGDDQALSRLANDKAFRARLIDLGFATIAISNEAGQTWSWDLPL